MRPSAAIAAQEVAQPADALRVEAVGGLVEDEHARVAEQRRRRARAAGACRASTCPPAGRRRRRARRAAAPRRRASAAARPSRRARAGGCGRERPGMGARDLELRADGARRVVELDVAAALDRRACRRSGARARGPCAASSSCPRRSGPRKPVTAPVAHAEGEVVDRRDGAVALRQAGGLDRGVCSSAPWIPERPRFDTSPSARRTGVARARTRGMADHMLLEGRRLLVTGVLTESSIAFSIARRAQEEGAEIVLTGFGRGHADHAARRAAAPDRARRARARRQRPRAARGGGERARRALGPRSTALVHAIAFVPGDALGGNFLDRAERRPRSPRSRRARSRSRRSPRRCCRCSSSAEAPGGAIVGLDFDATVAWPAYDWAGVSKAALESVSRYLARDLGPRGVRANLVAAGPLRRSPRATSTASTRSPRPGSARRRSAGT